MNQRLANASKWARRTHDPQDYAIKSWRYLRLAMPLLVIGLGVAVLYEWRKTASNCFQTSISAYYYTPVHGYFVSGVVGIGICLLCLRGNSDLEDVLLNFAGMFAVIVAFAPAKIPVPNCSSTPYSVVDPETKAQTVFIVEDVKANVANNFRALFAAGAVALIILTVEVWRRHRNGQVPGFGTTALVGNVLAVGVGLLLLALFCWDRTFFINGWAHNCSANLMFACVIVVVTLNAWAFRFRSLGLKRNYYPVIAVAMLASVAAFVAAMFAGWHHWLLGLETALIVLFAVFWSLQTKQFWGRTPPWDSEPELPA